MIQNLLTNISELLQIELAELITQPANHILAIPVAEAQPESLPLISIYPGKLEIIQNFKESGFTQPQVQEISQQIIIDPAQPAITYHLDKIPVKASTLCHLVVNQTESLLQEDKDFTIDYEQGTISFKKPLNKASRIRLNYSFIGNIVLREFTQEFFIDIWENNFPKVEEFASLISAMILSNHDELIKNFNFKNTTQYQTKQLISTHLISRIDFLNGSYHHLNEPRKFQVKFQVMGQLKLGKAVRETTLPIQTIQIVQQTPL